jgi:hypothetical protein
MVNCPFKIPFCYITGAIKSVHDKNEATVILHSGFGAANEHLPGLTASTFP